MDRSVQPPLAADMTTLTVSNEVIVLEAQPCHKSRRWHCGKNSGVHALKGLPVMLTGIALHQPRETHASAVPALQRTTLLWSRAPPELRRLDGCGLNSQMAFCTGSMQQIRQSLHRKG